jgi:acetylglutamate kinase
VTRLVLKIGGHALMTLDPRAPALVELAQDIEQLRTSGIDVAVVHGGGPQIAELLSDVGLEGHFLDGLRVTDETTMRYVAMALSRVNLAITSAFNHAGLRSVGISGVDTTLVCATAKGETWGRVGVEPKVRGDIVSDLWAHGVVPVISPVGVDDQGELLNCNADTVAGALAGALDAQVLVLLSDVDQLRSDPDDEATALNTVTREQARALLHSGGAKDGMRPKLLAALDALDAGAQRVVLANGTRRHALREAVSGASVTTEVTR